jgi:beta-N-acetylhexosaminidase
VEASRKELESADWVPFRAGIEAGARLAMSAHVAFPALEPDGARDRPATFSRAIATGLLRDEWGFGGLFCSDALMMGAVRGLTPGAAARRALEAGVDWLLYPPEPERVHAELSAAIGSGDLDRRRCERAAERLLALKRWATGSARESNAWSAASMAEAVAGAALVAEPAEPPPGHAWPDRAQWIVILDGGIESDEIVLDSELAPAAARNLVVIDTAAGGDAVLAAIAEARERCRGAWVACAVFSPVRAWKGRAGLTAAARGAIETVVGEAREAILILFSNPHIVNELQAPPRVVWTHGEAPACQRAVVDFLRGSLRATGRSPLRR